MLSRSILSLFCALILMTSAHAQDTLLLSIKPLQLIAAAVTDGIVPTQVLLPPGASPHHYALRPSDIRDLQAAELFYWIGPDLETFLEKPLQQREKPTFALQQLPGMHLRHFDADHDDGHGEPDHHHRPGSIDAHLWLSPDNALIIAAHMAETLARLDPARAEQYQANAKAFEIRIGQLDKQLKKRLAGVKDKPYFVSHEAFDYFEDAYGLKHRGVFTLSAEIQPGARHVASMRERLQQTGPACIFSEPPMKPRLIETLSQGLPVRMAELDAMGFSVEADAHGYEKLMTNLADALAECLEKI